MATQQLLALFGLIAFGAVIWLVFRQGRNVKPDGDNRMESDLPADRHGPTSGAD